MIPTNMIGLMTTPDDTKPRIISSISIQNCKKYPYSALRISPYIHVKTGKKCFLDIFLETISKSDSGIPERHEWVQRSLCDVAHNRSVYLKVLTI